MAIRRALTFMFQDRQWGLKLGLAILLHVPVVVLVALSFQRLRSAIPAGLEAAVSSPLWSLLVVGLAGVPLSGYALRITRQVIDGHDLPLPSWSDWRGILLDGLRYWGVVTLWSIPLTIAEHLAGVTSQPSEGQNLLASGLAALVGLATYLILPAATARLAATGSMTAGLDLLSALGAVQRNLGGYVRLLLVVYLGGAVLFGLAAAVALLVVRIGGVSFGPVGVQTLIEAGTLVMLLIGWYIRFVLAHLTGQVYAGTLRRREVGRLAPSGAA